jgi:hypothetical protein
VGETPAASKKIVTLSSHTGGEESQEIKHSSVYHHRFVRYQVCAIAAHGTSPLIA